MAIENQIKEAAIQAIKELYKHDINPDIIQVQLTRKDQNGDFTLVVFPLLKVSGKKPEDTGNDIGSFILEKLPAIDSFEVIKGFLNLTLSHDYWISALNAINADTDFGFVPVNQQSPQMMIEYSSPNTNKPLHLGHIRNNLLGYSLSRIAHANGYRVVKTNIVNDRGIHICKSMLAWKKWGNGETPESTGKKGDHLVGDYYVKFDQELKSEISTLVNQGVSKEEAEKQSVLMAEAREMLRQWEAGNAEVVGLWQMMNEWVYAGFNETYKALGVDFDKIYYESQTYSIGREMVLAGLEKGIFYKKDDGSVWG
jgi:arginyl-tRNA synthetase